MNAVPTLPINPEMPANATPATLQRDESQPAPSFMATLLKVKTDEPLPPSDNNQSDASPTFPGADQTASVLTGEEPHETDTAEPQINVLIDSSAELLPGGSIMEGTDPAIDVGVATDAEPAAHGAATVMSKDELGVDTRSDLKTADAPIVPQASASPPPKPQILLKNAAPVVLTAPEPVNANRQPGVATPPSSSTETFAKTAGPHAPAVEGIIGDSGSRARDTGEKGRPPTNAPLVTPEKRIPPQAGTGPHGPAAGNFENIPSQPEAARAAMAPIIRPSEASDRQTGLAMPAAASNLTATPGREPGKAASEILVTTSSARLAAEKAGPHNGPGLSADGESAEDQPRRWLAAEQTLETARNARPPSLEGDSRADWIAPVDRQGMTPVNKASQPIFIEKAPTPAGESFRSQNLDPIVERIAVSVRGNQSEARIALKPDHLGSIRLQIATDNGIVSIKIMAEFPMARDLLEAHLPQLKADLQQQGLELDEFNVTLDNEEQHFRREDRRQHGTFRPPSGRGRQKAHSDRPGHDRPEEDMSDRRSSANGVDFFA